MRVGLIGQVRQVWAPRGVAVSQAVQFARKYIYVAVAIDPMTGRLWWAWQKNMRGAEMARIWGAWEQDPAIDAGSGTGPAATRTRRCRPWPRPGWCSRPTPLN